MFRPVPLLHQLTSSPDSPSDLRQALPIRSCCGSSLQNWRDDSQVNYDLQVMLLTRQETGNYYSIGAHMGTSIGIRSFIALNHVGIRELMTKRGVFSIIVTEYKQLQVATWR